MGAYPKVLSLCSGIGGLDLGIRIACENARTVCYVEREAYCLAVLLARMETKELDEAPVWSDLATFDAKSWREVVDCVAAGFPCQPVSVSGKRKGSEDDRWLWPHVFRIIRECESPIVFLENVPGLVTLGFEAIVQDLEGLGYQVAAELLTAEEVGASHKRERLFVMAHTNGNSLRNETRQTQNFRRSNPDIRSSPVSERRRREEDQSDGQFGNPGEDVANSDCERGAGRRRSDDVAFKEGTTEGISQERQRCGNATDDSIGDFSIFPPRPDDMQLWQRVPRELHPAIPLESPIRGMADGISNRLDRLRVLGNAVVPQQAAKAWRLLWRKLLSERGAGLEDER